MNVVKLLTICDPRISGEKAESDQEDWLEVLCGGGSCGFSGRIWVCWNEN